MAFTMGLSREAFFKAFSSESTNMMTWLDVGSWSCCSISVASAKHDIILTTLERFSSAK